MASCGERLSSLDAFAPQIQLELKNKREFNTVIGGCCTIFFGILAISIIVIDLITVFIEPEMRKSEACLFVDYDVTDNDYEDLDTYLHLDTEKDQIMMRFDTSYDLGEYVPEQFLRIQYYYLDTLKKEPIFLNTEPCGNGEKEIN